MDILENLESHLKSRLYRVRLEVVFVPNLLQCTVPKLGLGTTGFLCTLIYVPVENSLQENKVRFAITKSASIKKTLLQDVEEFLLRSKIIAEKDWKKCNFMENHNA
jgi:hypothetical protein